MPIYNVINADNEIIHKVRAKDKKEVSNFIQRRYGDSSCFLRIETNKALTAKVARKEREQVYKSLGMTKVKGNLGGTYYE